MSNQNPVHNDTSTAPDALILPTDAAHACDAVPQRWLGDIVKDVNRFRGDPEKVRTSHASVVDFRGVQIHSRYGKAEELRAIIKFIAPIPEWSLKNVRSIFIDSKAGNVLTVTLAKGLDEDDGFIIVKQFEAGNWLNYTSSYNITFESEGKEEQSAGRYADIELPALF
jgi:hypothetical protein